MVRRIKEFHQSLHLPYRFYRKEVKDHGEGGSIIGYKPQDGDRAVIIEDVITAGSSVRESVPLLKSLADVNVTSLIISVDRMERGTNDKTAIQEVKEEFGIVTYPIVTVRDIINHLHGHEIDGKVVIDDAMREKMEEHLKKYGVEQCSLKKQSFEALLFILTLLFISYFASN